MESSKGGSSGAIDERPSLVARICDAAWQSVCIIFCIDSGVVEVEDPDPDYRSGGSVAYGGSVSHGGSGFGSGSDTGTGSGSGMCSGTGSGSGKSGSLCQPPLASTFDRGDEGWRIEGGSGAYPDHDPEGGNVGGHIASTARGKRYWIAPEKYRGDQSAAYGQILTFDLNVTDAHAADDLVILEGNGLSLSCKGTYLPGPAWTNYCLTLDDTGNWFNDRKRATSAEIRKVLSRLGQLKIRGGFTGGKQTCGIDNVALHRGAVRLSAPKESRIASSFDGGEEGWTVAGRDFGRTGVLDFEMNGGSPGGCIATTGRGLRYMIAPPEFRGDFAGAYGGYLSFDINVTDAHAADKLVYLEGGGHCLRYDGAYLPGNPWTHFCIPLDATGKWFNEENKRATEEEIRKTLTRLGQLKIRVGFTGGRTTCGLDNVTLHMNESRLAAPDGPVLTARFDNGLDGWAVAGGNLGRCGVLDHESEGGNPNGYLANTGGGQRYVIAPPSFRGDLSQSFGKEISFDLMATTAHTVDRLVVIEGGGLSLYCNGSYMPGNWTGYSVRLDKTGKWFRTSDNNRATDREIRLVLSRLGQLRIKGGFAGGKNTCGLDNVRLSLAD